MESLGVYILCNKQPIFQLLSPTETRVINLQFALQLQMEIMKAVSFMYVRPPGYNPESAKAAEIEDEKKKLDQGDAAEDAVAADTSSM
jgi:hypothetical protein